MRYQGSDIDPKDIVNCSESIVKILNRCMIYVLRGGKEMSGYKEMSKEQLLHEKDMLEQKFKEVQDRNL